MPADADRHGAAEAGDAADAGPGWTVGHAPPDLSPWRSATAGAPAYTLTLSSDRNGPGVAIVAIQHGNEVAGAIALARLLQAGFRPRRGQVTAIFANVEAMLRFDPERPTESRCVHLDMNRVWLEELLDADLHAIELDRARQLRPLVERADIVLDLHSMLHDGPPLTLCGQTEKARRLAVALGRPSYIVADGGHAFGRRLIDHTPFADEADPRVALLVECGQHWQPETVDVATDVTLRLLHHLEMLPRGFAGRLSPFARPPRAKRPTIVEVTEAVTVQTPDFGWVRPYRGMDRVRRRGTLIGLDGSRDIRTPYDDCLLVLPAARLPLGATAVRLGREVA